MRRTHPLRQPSAATSPNSMGEFTQKAKAHNMITIGSPAARSFVSWARSASQDDELFILFALHIPIRHVERSVAKSKHLGASAPHKPPLGQSFNADNRPIGRLFDIFSSKSYSP